MPRTLLQLANEVVYNVGNRTDLLDDTRTNAKFWVARAYQHLTQGVEFPEARASSTVATVAAQTLYSLPTDFFSIYTLKNDTQDKRMIQISHQAFEDMSTTRTGSPTHYSLFGSSLELWPTPSIDEAPETLTIRYRKFFPALTADPDTHLLPDIWEEGIVLQATAFGFDATNEVERAVHYRRMARAFVQRQQERLAENLQDLNEPIAPIGIEIWPRTGRT